LQPPKESEIQPSSEYEHLVASQTEGEGLAVIFYNKLLEAPPFDVVLEGDVEVLCLPPTTHLQIGTTDELVLALGHPGPAMIQILPKAKMGENPEVGLTQMHKDGNLQDRIRVQMGQIQIIEIKEAAEEGRNGKSKAADKKKT
jgi:hypothetical protein